MHGCEKRPGNGSEDAQATGPVWPGQDGHTQLLLGIMPQAECQHSIEGNHYHVQDQPACLPCSVGS